MGVMALVNDPTRHVGHAARLQRNALITDLQLSLACEDYEDRFVGVAMFFIVGLGRNVYQAGIHDLQAIKAQLLDKEVNAKFRLSMLIVIGSLYSAVVRSAAPQAVICVYIVGMTVFHTINQGLKIQELLAKRHNIWLASGDVKKMKSKPWSEDHGFDFVGLGWN